MFYYPVPDPQGGQRNMFVLPLDENIWAKGDEIANKQKIYDNSHRGLMANQVGVLGELVAEAYFAHQGLEYIETKTTKNDYQFVSGKTIDVKTKDRTVAPRINFDCSVPLYNHDHQKPDYYLFISLQRNRSDKSDNIRRFSHAYILGAINQDQLHSRGRIWQAGDIDPDNGTKFWTACLNVSAENLVGVEDAGIVWREQASQALQLMSA